MTQILKSFADLKPAWEKAEAERESQTIKAVAQRLNLLSPKDIEYLDQYEPPLLEDSHLQTVDLSVYPNYPFPEPSLFESGL